MGAKKRPFYRLVVADARSPRDGRFIDAIGTYDPLADPAVVRIDVEKVRDWISRGAKPTDTARELLQAQGILARTGQQFGEAAPKERISRKAQAKAEAAAAAPPAEPAPAEPAEAAAPAAPPAPPETEAATAGGEVSASEPTGDATSAVEPAPGPVETHAEAPAEGAADIPATTPEEGSE
jgi:small subunit ribosomal protein S16